MSLCFIVCAFSLQKGKLPHAAPHWMCLESWKLHCPTLSYKWTLRACLEVVAGERSDSHRLDQSTVLSSIGDGRSMQLREGCTWSREGGGRHLPSQQGQPGQPWQSRWGEMSLPGHPRIPLYCLSPGACWLRLKSFEQSSVNVY